LAELGAELVLGDLSDPSSLIGAMGGVESVLLVSPLDLRQVELQHNLVEAAKRGGAEHVVKLSGLGTALDSPIRSGRWHAETEAEIEASGLKWTFLRPLFFFQNLLRMARMSGSLGVLPTTLGREVRIAMVDARDVGTVSAFCLLDDRQRGSKITVTGPEALSFPDVAERLSSATGRHVKCTPISREVARQNLVRNGAAWHADTLLEFDRAFEEGMGAATTQEVRKVTGLAPRRLAVFARDHLDRFLGETGEVA
jgi:uncharacterized protein YbjT (DUF2867 family)